MAYEPLVTITEFETPKGEFYKVKVIRQSMYSALRHQSRVVASRLATDVKRAEIKSLYNYLRTYAGETVNQLKARGL